MFLRINSPDRNLIWNMWAKVPNLSTAFYLYVDTKETQFLEDAVKEMLGAMKAGLLQFGAKKSSGAGKIIPVSVKERSFLMSKEQDRKEWFEEESLSDTAYEEVTINCPEVTDQKNKYTVVIKGKTEGAILVKGLSVSEFGEGAPDSENIRNAKSEYIVPGSSFRSFHTKSDGKDQHIS